jgi:hypothetical protein
MNIATWERIIIDFVNSHPEGVNFEDIRQGINFKTYHSSQELGQLVGSLVFHKSICRINEFEELYNPNHFRNRGTFKYYPTLRE